MVEAQGGDPAVVDDPWKVLPEAPVRVEVSWEGEAGSVARIDAEGLGRAAAALGAGRMKKGDPIDPAVGIEFYPKVGDHVDRGQPVATVHGRDDRAAAAAAVRVRAAITLSDRPVEPPPLVFGWHGGER